ncbi:MAG: hypothetical protein L0154_02070 [Chloroflexi bacterium]|nr:hypothetical protein [Chloroflexota bacterium]
MASLNSVSQPPPNSFGATGQFELPWGSFVKYVLEITVEAYEQMRTTADVWSHYDEETLTAILAEDHIAKIANSRPLQLKIHLEVPVRTQSMKTGANPTPIRTARKIDIQIYGSWQKDYRTRYFAWECKRICDRSTNTNLISEYVTAGIFRFCDSEYAAEVNDAGMIGYVIAGDISDIVEGINSSMSNPQRSRQLPINEKLFIDNPILNTKDIYKSEHYRTKDASKVRLYHVFMTFNWVTATTAITQT